VHAEYQCLGYMQLQQKWREIGFQENPPK